MLKAGDLNKPAKILAYSSGEWKTSSNCWAKVEVKDRVIFSPYAPAVHGAEITIRKTTITPAYALSIGGQHYMLTEPIEEIESGAGLKIQAAAVTPITCTHEAPTFTMGATYNRPVAGTPTTTTFDGVLAQKYVRWQQQEPNATTENGLILTTPKAVTLAVGDIIKISGEPYAVRVCYPLAVYRNDYEIVREADA